jgi:hypothetical protein
MRLARSRFRIQMIEQAKDTAFYAPLRLPLLTELGSSGDARSVAFMFLFLSMYMYRHYSIARYWCSHTRA